MTRGALAEAHNDSWGGMFCWAPSKQGGSPILPLIAVAAYRVVEMCEERQGSASPPMAGSCLFLPQVVAELLNAGSQWLQTLDYGFLSFSTLAMLEG